MIIRKYFPVAFLFSLLSLSGCDFSRELSPSEIASEGDRISFKVCNQSDEWIRPDERLQRSKWWENGRYVGISNKVIQFPWTHQFFVVYGHASFEYDIINLSGLWTLPSGENLGCLCPETHDAILKLNSAEVWILDHELKDVRCKNNSCALIVEESAGIVEFITFQRPTNDVPMSYYFLDPDMRVLDSIIEADYPYWPYPSLVHNND